MDVKILTDAQSEKLEDRLDKKAEEATEWWGSTGMDDGSDSSSEVEEESEYRISQAEEVTVLNKDEEPVSKEVVAGGGSNPDETIWLMTNLLSVRARKNENEDVLERMKKDDGIKIKQKSEDYVWVGFKLSEISQFKTTQE